MPTKKTRRPPAAQRKPYTVVAWVIDARHPLIQHVSARSAQRARELVQRHGRQTLIIIAILDGFCHESRR